ncbi:MAG: phosphopantetheine adenylyltransferase [Sulfuricurvum sp. PC08-66]|nr:MAG: phosphopantetheine adenylyltransferase [Sulfuricurvum sp. PC08-66]
MHTVRRAIYPGTFDPITNGHLDIIHRGLGLFDEIIIAVATNQAKRPMFNLEKRIAMVEMATADLKRVRVLGFDTLVVEFAKAQEASILIRGLRAVSDFEYELQMGYANTSLDGSIETVYLMPNLNHAFISSSIVRNLIPYHGKITHLVPHAILPMLESM